MIHKIILFTILFVVSLSSMAFDSKPERRKQQNPTVPAYFLIPLPYSKPGIGDGFLLMGNIANVAGSTADISILQITGDAGGTILHGKEIPLLSDWLSLEFNYQDITRANINRYSKRGMEGTNKEDFNILEIGFAKQLNTVLFLNFYNKRLNFYYSHSEGSYRIDAIKENNGAFIETLNFEDSYKQDAFTMELDFTDDYLDPRNGFRFGVSYENHAADGSNDADFYTLNFNLLAYVPMGKANTLVFNYYQSGAHVNRKGNTDPAAIRAELNTNCAPTDTDCLQAEQELVDNFINERTYGTASDLGGDERLRSYPGGRFKGAYSAFFGAEYRWNITQESTPFDYLIWKDVRTGIQAAFFAEAATVAETTSNLWDEIRYSVGVGIRLITGSGGVYRAEIASGNEGAEVIVIFNYPWH